MFAGQLERVLRESTWDIKKAAQELTRFEFIAQFALRQTLTKSGRDAASGYQVIRKGKLYSYRQTEGPKVPLMAWGSADKLYDAIRRTPLGYYTRRGDELRAELLTAR